jgi:hypothetical protein
LNQILKRQSSRFHYGSKFPAVTITVFMSEWLLNLCTKFKSDVRLYYNIFYRGFVIHWCFSYSLTCTCFQHDFHIIWWLCHVIVTGQMPPVEQEIRTILEHWSSSPISERGSPCSICSFLCSVLWTFVCPFVCFLLAIVLSVHRFTVSDYSLINANYFCTKTSRNDWKKPIMT